MVLAMSRRWPHPKTGVFWFHRRVPKDILALVVRCEEKASLSTKDVGEAKHRHAALVEPEEPGGRRRRFGPRPQPLARSSSPAAVSVTATDPDGDAQYRQEVAPEWYGRPPCNGSRSSGG